MIEVKGYKFPIALKGAVGKELSFVDNPRFDVMFSYKKRPGMNFQYKANGAFLVTTAGTEHRWFCKVVMAAGLITEVINERLLPDAR